MKKPEKPAIEVDLQPDYQTGEVEAPQYVMSVLKERSFDIEVCLLDDHSRLKDLSKQGFEVKAVVSTQYGAQVLLQKTL